MERSNILSQFQVVTQKLDMIIKVGLVPLQFIIYYNKKKPRHSNENLELFDDFHQYDPDAGATWVRLL
jgi:hypothetical protein